MHSDVPSCLSFWAELSCFQIASMCCVAYVEEWPSFFHSKYMIGARKCLETSLTKWDARCFIIHKCLSETCSLWIAVYAMGSFCTREWPATGRLEQHTGVLCINDEVAFCCKQNYISPMKTDTVLTSVIFTYTRNSGILRSSTFHMK